MIFVGSWPRPATNILPDNPTSGYLLASHGLFLDFLVLGRDQPVSRSPEAASIYLMPFDVIDEHLVSLLRNQDTARFYWDSLIVLRETEFSLSKPSGYGPFAYTKRGLSHPKICLSNSRRNYLKGWSPGPSCHTVMAVCYARIEVVLGIWYDDNPSS